MASTKEAIGLLVGIGLILIPEPITTATGTILGAAIIASIFGVSAGVLG